MVHEYNLDKKYELFKITEKRYRDMKRQIKRYEKCYNVILDVPLVFGLLIKHVLGENCKQYRVFSNPTLYKSIYALMLYQL